MSHSSPGAGEVQDLSGLSNISAEMFVYFLAAMYRFEQLNAIFMPLLADKKYEKNNPYEYMLLQKFFNSHVESIKLYKKKLVELFWTEAKDGDEQYRIIEQYLRDKKPVVNLIGDVEKFCREKLGIPSKDNAKTKKVMEFINNLLNDEDFYKDLVNEILVCIELHTYPNKSQAIKTSLKITDKDAAAETPLAISFQLIAKIPLLMTEVIKTKIKIKDMDFISLNQAVSKMASSVKSLKDHNDLFIFNAAKLLSAIHLLETKETNDTTRTLLNLIKLSSALPKIYDNYDYRKKYKTPFLKTELETIAEVRACMNALQGNETDFVAAVSKQFPELHDTLGDIKNLFGKIEAIAEIKENPPKAKLPTNVTIDPEDLDYAVNRYLYAFTPPKPIISAQEAETLLTYIQEHGTELTAHSVIVLQNAAPKSKSTLETATAAVKFAVIKRRTSSTASEQMVRGTESPPKAISPEDLTPAGFTLYDVFPIESGMKIKPPPIPTKATPGIPERSYDKTRVRKSLEKAAAPDTGKPPMPPRPKAKADTTTKAAPVATKPVVANPPVVEKTPAPMVINTPKKRDSFTSGDKGVIKGKDGPSDELAEKLKRRLTIIDEKSKPAEQKQSEKPKPPTRGGSPTNSI